MKLLQYKKRPMWALQQAETTKHSTYGALCTPSSFLPEGLELHPIAFDIYGSIGPSAEKGLNPLFEFILRKRGRLQAPKRRAVLTQLSSTVLQLSRGCYQPSPN